MSTRGSVPWMPLAAVFLCIAVVGCSTTLGRVPPGAVPTLVEAQQDAFGSWVRVDLSGSDKEVIEGELIAVSQDSLYVAQTTGVIGIPAWRATRVQMRSHLSSGSGIAAWTVVGVLSTPSHGAFLIFTAPFWIIGGSVLTHEASNVGTYSRRLEVPREPQPGPWGPGRKADRLRDSWAQVQEALRPYARFPAGLPPSVDRQAIVARHLVDHGG